MAEAHLTLGGIYTHSWDFNGALRECRRATEINPGSATAHHQCAYALVLMGRGDEAVSEIRRAQALDPLSITTNIDVGEVLLYARRYDEAIEALKTAIEMDPNRANAHYDLGQAYEQKGLDDEAVEEYLRAWTIEHYEAPEATQRLKEAYERSGMRGFWRKRLEMGKEIVARGVFTPAFYIAELHALAGERERAFEWLEKAYEERSPLLIDLKVRSEFDGLRSDPRYADLLRRVGLP